MVYRVFDDDMEIVEVFSTREAAEEFKENYENDIFEKLWPKYEMQAYESLTNYTNNLLDIDEVEE